MIRRSIALAALALAGCGDSSPLATAPIEAPPQEAPATSKCDPYTGPGLASLNHYEGMTHEHSAYSDGDPHFIPADYYRIGKEAGYAFVAGSEHSDSLDSGDYLTLHASCDPSSGHYDPTALEYCFLNPSVDKLFKWQSTAAQATEVSTPDFLAIRGFEWTSDVFGHINVYFSQNFTNAKDDGGYALTMATFWDWFTRDPNVPGLAGAASSPVPFGGGADGLAHFNHPHDKCLLNDAPAPILQGVCDWNDYEYVPAAGERMFAIEAYNDSNREDRYLPYLTRALDRGWHLSFVGSEDEHFAHYAVEERPKTVTLATDVSEAAFREAWLARRTYALTPGRHLRAELVVDHQAPMGARLSCDSQSGPIALHAKVTSREGTLFYGTYRLFSNGGEEIATASGYSAGFELPVEEGKERYYFLRVDAPDATSVAYLAPVWIRGKPAGGTSPFETLLDTAVVNESSGLARSHLDPFVFWTHNDSGGQPRGYAVDAHGHFLGSLAVTPAVNADWEDMTSFVEDGHPRLLFADIGDNDAFRPFVTLFIVDEPSFTGLAAPFSLRATPVRVINVSYPGGSRDAESVAVDAAEGAIYILSKRDAVPRLYRVPLAPTAPAVIAEDLGEINVPRAPEGTEDPERINWITSMDIDEGASQLVLIGLTQAHLYRRTPGESWAVALQRAPLSFDIPDYDQIEAVAFAPDGKSIYLTSEGSPAPFARVPLPH